MLKLRKVGAVFSAVVLVVFMISGLLPINNSKVLAVVEPDVNTANPNASTAARKVLQYVATLHNNSSKRVLMGQFCGYPNANIIGENSFSFTPFTEVYNRTGKYPALMGADYGGRTSADDTNIREVNYTKVNPQLITHWNNGGLILLTLHVPNPQYTNGGLSGPGFRTPMGSQLSQILPGGTYRANWLVIMDEIAAGLQQLEDDGIVVMLRPFHEAPSVFWWQTKW